MLTFLSPVAAQNLCGDRISLEQEQKRRKEEFSKMYRPGEKASNLMLGDVSLYDIKSENILMIFWRTDCPYCEKLLKIIDKSIVKSDPKELQIIMICLDDNVKQADVFPFSKKYPNVLNVVDGKGYFGKAAKHYNVFATPTMIILDKMYRFVKLPKDVDQLKEIL